MGETQKVSGKTKLRRVFMFLLFLISFLLLGVLPEVYIVVGFSIVLGIIVWIITGKLAVPIINRVLILPTKAIMGKHLYLLAPKPKEKPTFFGRLLAVTDETILPTLFFFGIANYLLNSNVKLNEAIFSFVIVLIVPLLGLFIPILKVLLDSDLIRFNPKDRLIEPVGRQYLLYLRGIAGYTAIVSFFLSIYRLAMAVSFDVVYITLAAFVIAYTEIYIVVFIYSYVHSKFVNNLNEELREKYTYLEITAVESLERGFMKFVKA